MNQRLSRFTNMFYNFFFFSEAVFHSTKSTHYAISYQIHLIVPTKNMWGGSVSRCLGGLHLDSLHGQFKAAWAQQRNGGMWISGNCGICSPRKVASYGAYNWPISTGKRDNSRDMNSSPINVIDKVSSLFQPYYVSMSIWSNIYDLWLKYCIQ